MLASRHSPDQLARDHLEMAERRALRLGPAHGLPLDEARSAALLGLAEAIDRYRPEAENPETDPFAPFARATIDGRILDAARAWGWRGRAGEQPGRELVSDEQLVALIPDSLPERELVEARTDILRALRALSRVERQVVLLHGKMGFPLSIVADQLGLGSEHCRYLWRRALGRMRIELEGASAPVQLTCGPASPAGDPIPAPPPLAA